MAARPAFPPSPRVALVGAGSVGTAVATLLTSRGHDVVAVWSRSSERAASAAEILEAPIATSSAAAVERADLVLVGVVDSAIAGVTESFASALQRGAIVVHFAGALGIAPLARVSGSGTHAAALHPVQSIPTPSIGVERLPGSAWGVTSDTPIRSWAHDFVANELGGIPVDVAEADRALWHAAAVMTSNGIAAVMSTGIALLNGLAVRDPAAVLGPLAAGTVANVGALGRGGDAFTGPVVRGDRTTVEEHLAALRARYPELLDEYTSVARAIVYGAVRTARIEDETARSMHALLESA